MKKVLVLVFILIPSISFAITGHSTVPEALPTTEGQLVFQESGCVMCHGVNGAGDGFLAEGLNPKPRDFTSYEQMSRLPDIRLADAIRNGIAGTAMPAFPQFSDNQIQDVVHFLRSLLAESYLTVNMCVTDTQVIDSQKGHADFKVETDNPDIMDAKKEGAHINVTPNLKYFFTKPKKVTRTHIRVVESINNSKEKNVSLIAVRIHHCVR